MSTATIERPALTDDQVEAYMNELLSRPPRPGHFRCPDCRFHYPQDDRHALFDDVCDSCGLARLEALIERIVGQPTAANQARALRILEELASRPK